MLRYSVWKCQLYKLQPVSRFFMAQQYQVTINLQSIGPSPIHQFLMSHSILLTGASGYLGGTVLARWKEAKLPSYSHFYTLVRSTEQGDQVKQYGAEPLLANLNDPEDLAAKIVDLKITIVYLLVDAYSAKHQPGIIEALGKVKENT